MTVRNGCSPLGLKGHKDQRVRMACPVPLARKDQQVRQVSPEMTVRKAPQGQQAQQEPMGSPEHPVLLAQRVLPESQVLTEQQESKARLARQDCRVRLVPMAFKAPQGRRVQQGLKVRQVSTVQTA